MSPRRGVTHPSMISIWNGPKQTLSLTMTSPSMSISWGPLLAPSDWVSTLPRARTAVLFQQESNCTILTVAQGIERGSILLSQMTLIIRPILQVPMTKGTLRLNSTSSSYPAISYTCMCRIMNPSRLVHFLPNPTRFNGWSTRSSSSRIGNPYCCMKAGMIVFT